ncbi:Guanine deaminase [Aliiroseovarius sp. xm-m-379]|uniref:guanine deaminase n=1 Tax=unclassified Aliiroseovarius TaxID=2623558 RepID=UPI001568F20E|nr:MULTISPECIES: guanine deaminase [unclassified Aliiroseovarius]NRP12740.1 Guanine deaminase [Aliiroseovarius sp. xm-d-517]NRP24427.1 Guanine deaminase [Aliiroseovarius sp. xm-m-379]NRP29762.1 Guanine deaminase [Aliiroseovarius sp. xm-m-314]NRP33226.1 Guanine deaminase [Aliiroseovarius sp. xm-a-104]NRP39773.1 Guanine deaminase [Aliiroseovarius sp. xm-m-339-2]
MQLLLGQTLTFTENPFTTRPDEATRHHARGGVVIDAGRIIAVGPADDMPAHYPQAQVTDYGNALISPGFIDAHAHYPQTAIIASWGKRLIDWLNSYTFPEESRFADRIHAQGIAESYFDLVTAAGTTTTVSYCTIHPESVDAYFTAAQHRGLRVFGGKTCMDRNAPDTLTDTAQSAYEDSKALLEKWHGVDRLSYVITPRFAPTSTPEQLDALGTLWREHPDLLMQTHISEQHEEIAWVQDLFPDSRDYLDVYEKFGLAREGALFGHAIHLTERERDRLHEMKASLIHCPTSNMFIGSGLFDMAGLMATGQRIGLATDTGGGSSFSMLRTMAAAYEVGQLSGTALHPAQLWWLATAGSAQSLLMGDVIGTLAPGYEADLAVIDLSSTPAIAQRAARAEDLWQALFPTIMMGDDRAVTSVWAGGRKLY